MLARVVRGLSGEVPLRLHYRPRFEYGRRVSQLVRQDDAVVASAASARLDLRATIPLVCEVGEAFGSFTVRAGERDRAGQLFERLADRVNDLGLFAEQIDPDSGEALGNFPQAFSHIGLINAGDLTDLDAGRHHLPPAPERLVPAPQQG